MNLKAKSKNEVLSQSYGSSGRSNPFKVCPQPPVTILLIRSFSLILSSAKAGRICSVFYGFLLFSTFLPGFNTPETRTNERNSGVWRHVKKETDESRASHAEKYKTCQGCQESEYPLINPLTSYMYEEAFKLT